MTSVKPNDASESSSAKRLRNCYRYSNKTLQQTKSIEMRRSRLCSQPRKPGKSMHATDPREQIYIIVTIGAAMESAKKKVYPSLWNLYKNGQLPTNLKFYTFARSPMSREELREKYHSYMRVTVDDSKKYEEFWNLNSHHVGNYLARVDYEALHKDLTNAEAANSVTNRLIILIIPNTFVESVAQNLRTLAQSKHGWTRVITEKPFGKDIVSSFKVTQQLLSLCTEEDLFRVDTYLCKNVVQNILTIRFCNYLFSSTWNRNMIDNVTITLKDDSPSVTKGRYTDSYGIICDNIQLHGLQLLALIAMEKPMLMKADEIRDEKVKLLKCISPIPLSNAVLGQYIGNIPKELTESRSSTFDDSDNKMKTNPLSFCTTAIQIKNERWDGVPFILSCGKGLDERKAEIRVRYQDVPADIFQTKTAQNELVIEIEPQEKVYIRAVTKLDDPSQEITELPLRDSSEIDRDDNMIECYEAMLLNAISGIQIHFIRTAEMKQSWRIFTPLLNKIDSGEAEIFKYNFGSAGPAESKNFIRKHLSKDDVLRSVTR